MPSTWRFPAARPRAALAGGAALLCLAAGCGTDQGDEPAASSPSPSATSTSPSETPTPSGTATSETSSPSSPTTPSSSVPTTPGPWLGARGFPTVNDASRWTVVRTGPAGTDSFGVCQKFDMATIGAEKVREQVLRTDGAQAGQQLVTFPDPMTRVRAERVLRSWHDDCAGRVQGRGVRVGDITPVPVPRGDGWWYLVRWRAGGSGHFESLGVTFAGKKMSLVRIAHRGQDHNYEPGQDPTELAVQRAAEKLG